jgi:hypothetical protein
VQHFQSQALHSTSSRPCEPGTTPGICVESLLSDCMYAAHWRCCQHLHYTKIIRVSITCRGIRVSLILYWVRSSHLKMANMTEDTEIRSIQTACDTEDRSRTTKGRQTGVCSMFRTRRPLSALSTHSPRQIRKICRSKGPYAG